MAAVKKVNNLEVRGVITRSAGFCIWMEAFPAGHQNSSKFMQNSRRQGWEHFLSILYECS